MTTSDVLKHAAEYLRANGHCKHALEDGRGRVCLFGALNAVSTGFPERWGPGLDALRARLLKVLGLGPADPFEAWEGHVQLVDWNNAEQRTAEEVIEALEKASALEDSDV